MQKQATQDLMDHYTQKQEPQLGVVPLRPNTVAGRQEQLWLTTLDQDTGVRIKQKKKIKLMNWQHRVLKQRMVQVGAE